MCKIVPCVKRQGSAVKDVIHVFLKANSTLTYSLLLLLSISIFLFKTIWEIMLQLDELYKYHLYNYAALLQIPVNRNKQGPVVQSIVSLTSPLRSQLVKCFTTL